MKQLCLDVLFPLPNKPVLSVFLSPGLWESFLLHPDLVKQAKPALNTNKKPEGPGRGTADLESLVVAHCAFPPGQM